MLQNKDNTFDNSKKIGFILQYSFHYFVYKNIYNELKKMGKNVCFIIDPTGFYPVKPAEETLIKIRKLLKKENVDFVEFKYENYLSLTEINLFLEDYSVLVSTWHRGIIKESKKQRKVFVTYGPGKELTTFGFWKRNFDLCLAYGKYDDFFFSQVSQSKIVGNPKFDDWFSKKFDKNLINFIKPKLNINKKTILYLPTHSDLCSISQIYSELKIVAKEYNVITKLHYLTPQEQPELVKMLTDKNIILLEDDMDLITLLFLSDLVLSDNSSAIFDAILADKPILVTDFLSTDYFNTEHQEGKKYRRGISRALTYSNSIEQRIKKERIVMSIKNPKELSNGILSVLIDKQKEKRLSCSKEIFEYRDTNSGKRAAEEIIILLNQKILPDKPFLSYAIDNFERETIENNNWINKMSTDNSLENFSKKIAFIIIDSDSLESLLNTVASVVSFKKISSVIIITKNEGKIALEIKNIFFENKFFYYENELLEAFIKHASEYDKFVMLYSGCIFSRKSTNLEQDLDFIESKIFSNDSLVSSGYVSVTENKFLKNVGNIILSLEKYQSMGISVIGFTEDIFFDVSNVVWNNAIDDPRFVIFDSSIIKKVLEKSEKDLNYPYYFLLSSKALAMFNNFPVSFLNIKITDTVSRENFLSYKILSRVIFEARIGIRYTNVFRRYVHLCIILFCVKVSNLKAFPKILYYFFITSVVYWFVVFYKKIKEQQTRLNM